MAELGFGPGEADAESFDLAEPTFPVGFGDPVEEIVADLHEPAALGGVGAQEGAADAGFSELPAAARQRLPVNRWRLRGRAS